MVETAPDGKSRIDFANRSDANGVTPLQMAAMEGYARIARCLIEQGAQVNSRDKDDATPLHWAAENLCPGMVELLLEHLKGEDRMLYDNEFCTPADSLARRLENGGVLKKTAEDSNGSSVKLWHSEKRETMMSSPMHSTG